MIVPVLVAFTSLAQGETCPAGVDVEVRVRETLHLPPERDLTESFLVERHEAGLYVMLRAEDQSVIGERTLPAQGSCDELAQAAAVVLSAWLTDVHPDFAGALPPPEPKPEPPPEPPQPPLPPPPKVAKPPPAPTMAPYRLEGSLGAGVDFADGSFAPAALVGFGVLPARSGFGLVAGAQLDWTRTEAIASGKVAWLRWPLNIAADLRLSGSTLVWDFGLGPALAWLNLAGHSFEESDRSASALVPGVIAAVRVSGAARHVRPFALLGAQVYPKKSTIWVGNSSTELVLSPLTVSLMAGVSLAQ